METGIDMIRQKSLLNVDVGGGGGESEKRMKNPPLLNPGDK